MPFTIVYVEEEDYKPENTTKKSIYKFNNINSLNKTNQNQQIKSIIER